jgi:hypothetical protein
MHTACHNQGGDDDGKDSGSAKFLSEEVDRDWRDNHEAIHGDGVWEPAYCEDQNYSECDTNGEPGDNG